MIRVTIWYEYQQEKGVDPETATKPEWFEGTRDEFIKKVNDNAEGIKKVYPLGVMGTVADYLKRNEDMQITLVDMFMPECGLTDELLDNTDVLIYWAHVAHDNVPDELVKKIKDHVLKGMGFIPLHSAHKSKPFMELLGTSGCLKWREGDYSRVWCINPAHPIAAGISETIELSEEEMYGEPFDIPTPDDVVFISWFRGGEVFRSGCTWTRGYGKIFYFQPGHETSPSYHNPMIMKVIENAVRWASPTIKRENLECPNAKLSAEDAAKGKALE